MGSNSQYVIVPAQQDSRFLFSDDGTWSEWSSGTRNGQQATAGASWIFMTSGLAMRVYGSAIVNDQGFTTNLSIQHSLNTTTTRLPLSSALDDSPTLLFNLSALNRDTQVQVTSDGPYIIDYIEIDPDDEGNTLPLSQVYSDSLFSVDNEDPNIKYGPSPSDWSLERSFGHYNKTISVTSTVGAWFEYQFYGDQVIMFSYHPVEADGLYRVEIDGNELTDDAGRHRGNFYQAWSYDKGALEWTNHTLRCTLTSGPRFSLDFLKVAGDPSVPSQEVPSTSPIEITQPSDTKHGLEPKVAIIVAIVIGVVILVLGVLIFFLCWVQGRRQALQKEYRDRRLQPRPRSPSASPTTAKWPELPSASFPVLRTPSPPTRPLPIPPLPPSPSHLPQNPSILEISEDDDDLVIIPHSQDHNHGFFTRWGTFQTILPGYFSPNPIVLEMTPSTTTTNMDASQTPPPQYLTAVGEWESDVSRGRLPSSRARAWETKARVG